jgi:alpha-L-fucosidase
MFDTKQTDYRITSPKTPFSSNPKADVTKEIFSAFRAQGMMVGAYFSKPDWHSPDYWWPNFATPDRNPNYDIKKYPDRWARFVEFTHAQVNELMSNYGKVDILWLDGGWVKKMTDAEIKAEMAAPDYKFTHVQSQDIDMPRLVREARARQPGLIVVDRAVPGPYQNYLTPENRVPPAMLPYPWEVPLTMARSWSYVPNDTYKSSHQLIQTLVDVVAKGGNLLLNIGPGPDGTWHDAAYDRLAALGAWMKVNSEAIYATRPIAPYVDGKLRFTRTKDGVVYVIYLPAAGETTMPADVVVTGIKPAPGATITLLGPGRTMTWEPSGAGFVVHTPPGATAPNADAWVLKIR